jgi:hypothetical protein
MRSEAKNAALFMCHFLDVNYGFERRNFKPASQFGAGRNSTIPTEARRQPLRTCRSYHRRRASLFRFLVFKYYRNAEP